MKNKSFALIGFIVIVISTVIGAIIYLNWYKPQIQTVNENINYRVKNVEDGSFWLWGNNTTDLNYINSSNYSFVILPREKLEDQTPNKFYALDLTNQEIDLNKLNNDPVLDKYESLGIVVNSSLFNEKLGAFKSQCNLGICRVNKASHFFIYMDEKLNTEALSYINSKPKYYSVIFDNYLQTNTYDSTDYNPEIFLFSRENVELYSGDEQHNWQNIIRLVENANNSGIKYSLDFEDKDYPQLSQLPTADIKVDYDAFPFLRWEIKAPHNGYSQDSYSVVISDTDHNYTQKNCLASQKANCFSSSNYKYLYTTGAVKTPFTQYTIIPETKVSGSSHSGLIQIWLDINYSGLEEIEEVPLLAQTFDIDFAFTSYEDFDGTNKDIKKIAWIPSWGMNTALEVLSRDPTYYSTLSPVWFKPNDNGTLQELPTTNNTSLMSLANQYDLDIVPTVALVGEDDKDTLHEILNGNIDQHVNSIVQKVEDYGYDGIDLDYEWTYSNPPNEEDPELLIELLTKLKQELGNKTLSFTVLPQWGDQIKYGYKPQTHEAQDWKKIGEIADEVRIMIYDYRGTGSSVPGPTAPYPWYLGVLRYAQSKIPNEKIILGIPLYGYSWKLNNTDSLSFPSDHTQGQTTYTLLEEYKNNPLASSAVMTSEGHAVMPITAYAQEDYMTHYGVNDNWNKEQVSVYYLGGWWYTSYLSKEDVNTRIETAENAGVGGVAFWRLVEF